MSRKALIFAILIYCLMCPYIYAQESDAENLVVADSAEDKMLGYQSGQQDEAVPVSEDLVEGTSEDQEALSSDATAESFYKIESEKHVEPQEGNVTLDFREADIRNVLRILSYKSGINIVPGPEVGGLVTIQLTDVPWEQALDVILETHGYGYEQKGNIIVVTTIDNLKSRRENRQLLAEQEELATRTFILNYAKADTAVGSVEKMLTSRGSINFDKRTNAIIVRDTPTNLKLIDEIIPILDATTPQVLIEAKIIETTLSNTENIGIDWVLKATASASGTQHMWPFSDSSANKYLAGATDNDPTGSFTYGTLDAATFSAVLELLRTRTDTNILSNPRIVTLDNEKATINVGSQYPLPNYTYNEEQGKMQVSGWSYMDIGIIFDVTPHVNKAGFITLDLEPKITQIIDEANVEGTAVPVLSNESVKTRVMIQQGETLVIAGLIKDNISDTRKKIPFFGDIPIFGLIFQKSEKSLTKTDLLIFITPHIITHDEEFDS